MLTIRPKASHVIFQLLALALLIGLTVLVLRPVQRTLHSYMLELRNSGIARMEALLKRNIEYGSLGPSVFNAIDIRDVRIYDTSDRTILTLKRVRIVYSIKALLLRNNAGIIRKIQLDEPGIHFDFQKDADLIPLFTPQDKALSINTTPVVTQFFPPGASIRINKGEAVFTDNENSIRVQNLSLQAERDTGGQLTFDGMVNADVKTSLLPELLGTVSTNAAFNGVLDEDLNGASFTVKLSSLQSAVMNIEQVNFGLALNSGMLEIRKIKDREAYDVFLGYNLETKAWKAEYQSESFNAGSLLSVQNEWEFMQSLLPTVLSGSLHAEGTAGTVRHYSFDLNGRLSEKSAYGKKTSPSFVISGKGSDTAVTFNTLRLSIFDGSVEYNGSLFFEPLLFDGYLVVDSIELNQGTALQATMQITSEANEHILFGERLAFGDLVLSAVDARIRTEQDGLFFTLSALLFSDLESYEDVRLARISAEGTYEAENTLLQTMVSIDSLAFSDALDILSPFVSLPDIGSSSLTQDLMITSDIFITSDFTQLSYNIPRILAAYGTENNELIALASISGTQNRFSLSDGNIMWDGGNAQFSSTVDFTDPDDISLSLQSIYKDVSYYAEAMLLDQRFLSIQGSYGLSANVSILDDGGFSGLFNAENVPIPVADSRPRLSVSGTFRWQSLDSWNVDFDSLSLADVVLAEMQPVSVLLEASANQDGVFVDSIQYLDMRGSLTGTAFMNWGDRFAVQNLELYLSDTAGNERYEAEGYVRNKVLDLRVYTAKAQSVRFFPNPYNAVLSGEVRLTFESLEKYRADWVISAMQARVGESELVVSSSGKISPESIAIEQLQFNLGSLRGGFDYFLLDSEQDKALVAANISGLVLGRELDMAFDSELSFIPIESWMDLGPALAEFNGLISVDHLNFDTFSSKEPFIFEVNRTLDSISAFGGPQNSVRLHRDADGAFYAAFSNPSPLRGSITGTIKDSYIQARGGDLYLDMTQLWDIIPFRDQVDFSGGFVNASLEIRGPVGDPEFFGTAVGNSMRMRVPQWVDAEIGPFQTTVTIEGNSMEFGPVRVPVDTGYGTVEGQFTIDRWVPRQMALYAKMDPQYPIPFRMDMFGLKARGIASGNLDLILNDREFAIGGALTVQNTLVTLDTRSMQAGSNAMARRNPALPVSVNLDLITGRKVEFAWPSDDFPIVRAYADIGTGILIKSDGADESFALNGDVVLRGGEVFYFQRSFYIREGVLRFNENELQFDPHIQIRAEIRDRSDDGPVTIALVVDDAPLSTFVPRLESDPPLSQYEIFALLGQNLAGTSGVDDPGRVQDAFINASSDLFAQFNVIRVFERNIRDTFNLDMFSVRTQVLQNAVLQASGLRAEPVDRIGTLGNYFDNTTVFLGKYLGPDVFMQSMVSIRYDETKMDNLLGGLTLEPDFGLEFKTPVFSLQWNFVPSHPENLFIDDHSFTFSWKWSY